MARPVIRHIRKHDQLPTSHQFVPLMMYLAQGPLMRICLEDYHIYSVVWYPSSIRFAVDSNYSAVITHNVPQRPGVLALSHWSDGNPYYSGGPPSSPAVLHISRAWVLYNISNMTLACQATNMPCRAGAAGLLPLSGTSPSGLSSSVSFSLLDLTCPCGLD